MKQFVVKYKAYSWSKGTLYTAEFPDMAVTEICCPILLNTHWCFEGQQYVLLSNSNTSSRLYVNNVGPVGEIHQSYPHWDVLYNSVSYKLLQLKRAAVLVSSSHFVATLKSNPIGRVTCTYTENKQTLLEMLLYVAFYYRRSLDTSSG